MYKMKLILSKFQPAIDFNPTTMYHTEITTYVNY